jgi:hypothetical protein
MSLSIIPPLPGQNRRLRTINNILMNYKEPDIPDKMIRKIKKKYPQIKDYTYLHTEEVNIDDMLHFVDLDLKNISNVYKCTKIIYRENKSIEQIVLRDMETKKYLKINPTKYYLFKVVEQFEIEIKKILKSIHK